MKLRPKQFTPILNALMALDGNYAAYEKTAVMVPFSFSAKASWNKTKNLSVLRKQLEDLEKTRLEVVTTHSGERGKNVPDDKLNDFALEWDKFLDTEVVVNGLLRLAEKELNLFDADLNPKGNKITSTTLEALLPLLELEATNPNVTEPVIK